MDFDVDTNFALHMKASDQSKRPSSSSKQAAWERLQSGVALESQYSFKPTEGSSRNAPPRDEAPKTDTRTQPLSNGRQATSASSLGGAKQSTTTNEATVPLPTPSPLRDATHQSSLASEQPPPDPRAEASSGYALLEGRFLCKLMKHHLLLIDIRHAQERILYEQLMDRESLQKPAQHLMFNEFIAFSTAELAYFKEAKTLLSEVGFVYDLKSEGIDLRALPMNLSEHNSVALFESILHALQQEFEPKQPNQKALWRLIAAQIAARQPTPQTEEEMRVLIERLFLSKQPNYTPSGQRTYCYLDKEALSYLFK